MMNTQRLIRTALACALTLLLVACDTDTQTAATPSIQVQVSGLWQYTGLRTSDGTDLPLTGIFLFKEDMFLQQAVFNEASLAEAGSMAHAGPFRPEPETGSVHLVAEQTISISPDDSPILSFQSNTEHDVTVTRKGDDLTLIFSMGTGTVQEFSYIGPGEGDLYKLDNGALAFVDGHFILVDGTEASVTTGYGTYTKQDESLSLNIIRWSESNGATATNLENTIVEATFDGAALQLADGRQFLVRQ